MRAEWVLLGLDLDEGMIEDLTDVLDCLFFESSLCCYSMYLKGKDTVGSEWKSL